MTRDGAGTEAAPAPDEAVGPRSMCAAQIAPADDLHQVAPLAAASPDELADKAASENFPVALRLLPRRYRAHLMAVYDFARTVDDIGDEAPPDQRLRLLDEVDEDLARLYANPAGQPRHPAVRGLASAVAECAIPVSCFRDLIDANRQDQLVTRYETFDQLLGYCALSANPVGRIVLLIFGCSTPERVELSDAICSGLQIVEHLQDVAEDMQAGRVYLPLRDMRSHDCTESDLTGSLASPQLRALIAAEADRAGALIDFGAPLVGQLGGAARVAVAGYVAGGRAALAAIARAGYDVLAATPKPAKSRTARELAAALVRGR